ncbi:MAG: TolC family protein [Acidobacteria bacterium]|nr:TolC family protein [Acidobacteriota bacterium]
MRLQTRAPACVLLALCGPLPGQVVDWTEARVMEKFLEQSPYAREAKAKAESARAEAAGRTLLPNPGAIGSREGAGYAAFFQLEQSLPVSGRRGLLKQAGAAAVEAAESDAAAVLWSLRMDVRRAFYRAVAAQTREGVLADGMRELEEVIRILRAREREGEGSRYDRLRAERELAEQRSQWALARSDTAQARAALTAYLPAGVSIQRVAAAIETPAMVPGLEELARRALSRRAEYIAEQRHMERYRLETRAAERLRYPEPVAIAGIKRGDVAPGRTETSPAIGIRISLPVFNKGQTEAAHWRAEQERSAARREALERRIRAEVAVAALALEARTAAVDQYRREVNEVGADLTRIARVSYQEGQIGILELLDSYRVNRQALLRLLDLRALAKEAVIELDRAVGEEATP